MTTVVDAGRLLELLRVFLKLGTTAFGGPAGALVATAGIFPRAFVFVAISGPLVPRLHASPLAGAFLDGINGASLALMAVVAAQLAPVAVVDLPTALLVMGAAILLLKLHVNSVWVVLAGAAVGILIA